MRAGVVLPRALVVKIIPQLESSVMTDPAKSLFNGPLTKFPAAFDEADRSRLTAAYQANYSIRCPYGEAHRPH